MTAPQMDGQNAKRPPSHWTREGVHGRAEVWTYGGLRVISEFLPACEAPDGSKEEIAQWLVSVSKRGRRPSDEDFARVRRAFDMEDAEEDNHFPGVARHLFLTVDVARRVECECKAEETVVTEPDGYRWSNTADECRGCVYARNFGRACDLHPVIAEVLG